MKRILTIQDLSCVVEQGTFGCAQYYFTKRHAFVLASCDYAVQVVNICLQVLAVMMLYRRLAYDGFE